MSLKIDTECNTLGFPRRTQESKQFAIDSSDTKPLSFFLPNSKATSKTESRTEPKTESKTEQKPKRPCDALHLKITPIPKPRWLLSEYCTRFILQVKLTENESGKKKRWLELQLSSRTTQHTSSRAISTYLMQPVARL